MRLLPAAAAAVVKSQPSDDTERIKSSPPMPVGRGIRPSCEIDFECFNAIRKGELRPCELVMGSVEDWKGIGMVWIQETLWLFSRFLPSWRPQIQRA